MSVRTTVTLDDDVLDRIRCESRSRNASFCATLNSLLRTALNLGNPQGLRMLKIKPVRMGHGPALNYNDVGRMLEDGMPTCGCAVKRRFASTSQPRWELVYANAECGPIPSANEHTALAIENGALLASTDEGFRRFPELRWINPLSR